MASTVDGVVVWEWLNEYGSWRPYEPEVVSFIEKYHGTNQRINLGVVDQKLVMYELDHGSKVQVRLETGTTRPIRRHIYPMDHPVAKGIVWQWAADQPGCWHLFDMITSSFIEAAYVQGIQKLDLSKTSLHMPYVIDLAMKQQTRIETGTVRNIRRETLPLPYPPSNVLPNQPILQPSISMNSAIPGSGHCSHDGKRKMMHRSGSLCSQDKSQVQSKRLKSCNSVSSSHSLSRPSMPTAYIQLTPIQSTSQTLSHSQPIMSTSFSNPFGTNYVMGTIHNGPVTRNMHQVTMNTQQNAAALQYPSFLNGSVVSSPLNSLPLTSSNSYYPVASPSVSVPVSQPSSSKTLGRLISPVVTSITNMLMSPAVPVLLSPSPSLPTFSTTSGKHSHRSVNNLQQGRIVLTKSSKSAHKGKPADEVLRRYLVQLDQLPRDEDCCICCDKLDQPSGYGNGTDNLSVQLNRCTHMFHRSCLYAMYDNGHKDGSIQCPTCKTIYGKKYGNCPDGEMQYITLLESLPGNSGYGTIRVVYNIRPGIQGPEHPNPGKKFTTKGFPRCGYLPDNEKGKKVLQLLITAWKRRLIFTIGTSTTTGEMNTVTWNEIHHKTELHTNYTGHGYPDPNYLDNVMMELAVQGVVEEDQDDDKEDN